MRFIYRLKCAGVLKLFLNIQNSNKIKTFYNMNRIEIELSDHINLSLFIYNTPATGIYHMGYNLDENTLMMKNFLYLVFYV